MKATHPASAARTIEAAKHSSEIKTTADRVVAAISSGAQVDPEDLVTLRGTTEALAAMAEEPVMFDIATIQPPAEQRDRNQARVTGDQIPCAVCGRPVKGAAREVHVSGHWRAYPNWVTCEQAETMPEGSMYFHPVGPECAKKIPAAYLH